jgi:hypothetical protein
MCMHLLVNVNEKHSSRILTLFSSGSFFQVNIMSMIRK